MHGPIYALSAKYTTAIHFLTFSHVLPCFSMPPYSTNICSAPLSGMKIATSGSCCLRQSVAKYLYPLLSNRSHASDPCPIEWHGLLSKYLRGAHRSVRADVGTNRLSQPPPGSVPPNPVQSSPPSSARMEPPFAQPGEGPPLSNVISYPPSISQFLHGSASLNYLLEARNSASPMRGE